MLVAVFALALALVDPQQQVSYIDRTHDGILFGTSYSALYRSLDSGQSWERLAEQNHLGAVFAFEDGSGAVVATEGGLSFWTKKHPTLEPVLARGASEKGVAEFFFGSPPPQAVQARKGNLWIATSYDTDRSEEAEGMLRSSDTVHAGPHFTALVYSSADGGHSWKEIDRYQGAVVEALWLGSDDVLRLCLSNGALRAATLDAPTGTPVAPGFANVTEPHKVGGSWGSWLAFPSKNEGLAGGNAYFGGSVLQRSEDGGRTWLSNETKYRGVVDAHLLGGGAAVRVVEASVEMWKESMFVETRRFEADVQDAHVDATGCLLVRLVGGEVWSLSADAQVWTKVGLMPIPDYRRDS